MCTDTITTTEDGASAWKQQILQSCRTSHLPLHSSLGSMALLLPAQHWLYSNQLNPWQL